MEKQKETEYETMKRCCDLASEKHWGNSYRNLSTQQKWVLTFEITQLYHSERLKLMTPSEEEIEDITEDSICEFEKEVKWHKWGRVSYRAGMRKAIKLLTGK